MVEFGTLSAALGALEAGDVSSVELTKAALEQADQHDGALGVFVSRFSDQALAAAALADETRARGEALPLAGIPIGIKDIVTTADGPTTAQSVVHDQSWGRDDAAVIQRLRAAGAVIIGKTTTMEFALGAPDPEKPFPQPRNPWDLTRWAGGSSSGSGSGVAAGMMWGAVGTDTGASVRMPAALCGVTGLKPTYGRVPKSDCVPFGYSLDCVGPMAPSARDCAHLLAVMAGCHPDDRATSTQPVPDYVSALDVADLTGVRIGVDALSRFSGEGADPAVEPLLQDAASVFHAAGAELVDIEIPHYGEVTASLVITLLAEALAYHLPDLRNRWSDYFAFTRAGLASAAFVTGADYVQAQRIRRWAQKAVADLFTRVDIILSPTVSSPAPALCDAGSYTATLFAGHDLAYHTAYWDALGHPALALPMGFNAHGLPLSAQLIGPPFGEGALLRAGDVFQRSTDWHLHRASLDGPRQADAAAEVPSAPVLDERTVEAGRSMLRIAGIQPTDAEEDAVLASVEMVRANANKLYGIPETRYEEPALMFPALP